MTKGLVTVFGGSGFVGKHVVRALVKDGWRVRVPMRRPHTGQDLKVIGNVGQVQLVQANIRYPLSVDRAVAGSDAVINLVGILFNKGKQNFTSLHSKGAENVAAAVKNAGIRNFVHMSALGAAKDANAYSQSRGEGEARVRADVASADIMRPSIIFGPEDTFFNRFAALANLSPVAMPLIGGGHTRFQPVYVGDVAKAIAATIGQGTKGRTYELGGPETYTFRQLIEFTLKTIDRRRILLPLPWFISQLLGTAGEIIGFLPFIDPFLTRDQVRSLKVDNLVDEAALSFSDLGIRQLETIEAVVPAYLARYQQYGQFHARST